LAAFGLGDICASTTRPINLIKDIYLPAADVNLEKTSMVLKNKILESSENYVIYSVDETHMPGQNPRW